MSLETFKYQPPHAVDEITKIMRDRVHCTNGCVIIVDDRTKAAVFGTVQGDLGRSIEMLERTLASLKKMKAKQDAGGGAPLIMPVM